MSKFEYRMAGLMDLHEVAELYGDMARELDIAGMPHDRNAQERYLLLVIDSLVGPNPAAIFIAVNNGKIVGFIHGDMVVDSYRGRKVGRCHHLFVNPEFRGRGIALKLIRLLENLGKKLGVEVSEIQATPGREKAYERFGFRPVSLKMVKGE